MPELFGERVSAFGIFGGDIVVFAGVVRVIV